MTSTGAGLVICWTDGFCNWCASWCSSYLIIACFLAAMSLLLTSVEMPSNSLHCFFLKLSDSVSYRVERAWSRYFQNSVPVRLHSTYQYVYPFFFIFHFFLRVPMLNIYTLSSFWLCVWSEENFCRIIKSSRNTLLNSL